MVGEGGQLIFDAVNYYLSCGFSIDLLGYIIFSAPFMHTWSPSLQHAGFLLAL
jgi:hypothetical protein